STCAGFSIWVRAVRHRSAVLLLVITSVLWSLGGVLLKQVDWHPMAKAGARSAIAAVVIFAWLRRPKFSWSPNQILGAAAYAVTVSTFVIATDLTTAANAIFLQYTAPAYVAVLGWWMLGERTQPRDWLCIALAVAGVAMLCRDGLAANNFAGIAAGLASGFCMALMVIFLRREKDGSPVAALLLGNIATAVIGLPFGILGAGKMPDATGWAALVTLGVLQLGVPYILYGLAIRHVSAIEGILIPLLEPVLNPLWVFIFLGEVPRAWTVAGASLVLVAMLSRGLWNPQSRKS
ncbi:MAG: DMT family transporter, partial [Chthoniobacteraceae bacterium]